VSNIISIFCGLDVQKGLKRKLNEWLEDKPHYAHVCLKGGWIVFKYDHHEAGWQEIGIPMTHKSCFDANTTQSDVIELFEHSKDFIRGVIGVSVWGLESEET